LEGCRKNVFQFVIQKKEDLFLSVRFFLEDAKTVESEEQNYLQSHRKEKAKKKKKQRQKKEKKAVSLPGKQDFR